MTPKQTVVGSPAVFYNALAGNVVGLIAEWNRRPNSVKPKTGCQSRSFGFVCEW